MSILLQVGIGGALGAICRFVVVQQAVRMFGSGFGMGTMAVNIAGSFVMGIAFVYLTSRTGVPLAKFSPLLMAGFLGGFTTFSAFSLEALSLIHQGRLTAATGYIGGSVVLSIAALAVGMILAKAVWQ